MKKKPGSKRYHPYKDDSEKSKTTNKTYNTYNIHYNYPSLPPIIQPKNDEPVKPAQTVIKNNVFDEIKMPDMTRDIRKTIEVKEDIADFQELTFKSLEDIVKYGESFIDLIDQNNNKKGKIISLRKVTQGDDFFEDLLEKKYSIDDKIEVDKDGLYKFFDKRYSVNPRKLMRLVKPIKLLNAMIGMQSVKKNIYKFISSYLREGTNNGMLNTAIFGKPGIGKTDLGKILCMIYSALDIVSNTRFTMVKASELVGEFIGQTRQKTAKIMKEAGGGVLFIDEAYSLMSGSSNGRDGKASYGKECIDTINQELSENKNNLVVIIAGYEEDIINNFFKVNAGLDRRFPFRYTLTEYSKEELKDIFIKMIRLKDNFYLDTNVTDEDIIKLFDDTNKYKNCGGDIENLITHISFANHERTLGKMPNIRNIITKKDIKEGYKMFISHKEKEEPVSDTWKKMFI